MNNEYVDLSTVVISLPCPFLKVFKKKRNIGFKFGTLAYAIVCRLYEPKIDFHQIIEMQQLDKQSATIKLIIGGAYSFAIEHGKKNIVDEKLVNYWINKLRADKRDKFIDKINIAILNCSIVGESMTKLLGEKKEVKKK